MSFRLRTLTTSALALALILLCGGPLTHSALAASLLGQVGPADDTSLAAASGAGFAPLRITAADPTLTPGLVSEVQVEVTNPAGNPAPVSLRTVAVVVGDAGPGCPAETLVVSGYAAGGRVTVRPGARVVVPVRIAMQEPVREAHGCLGRTFPLTYAATAVPA